MKNYNLLLFIVLSINLYSQNKKTFYNEDFTYESDSLKSRYYQIVENYYTPQEKYKFVIYYNSGVKYMEGFTLNRNQLEKTDTLITYYKNGKVFSQSQWDKNIEIGMSKEYYPSGQLMNIISNKKSKKFIEESWDTTGYKTSISGNGLSYKTDLKGRIVEHFEIKKGLKNGKCTGNDYYLKIRFEEYYKKGKLIKGISFDSINTKHEYNEIEIPTSFLGGSISSFREYVIENIKFPRYIIENKGSGRIVCQFIINEDGKMTNLKIIKSSGNNDMDAAVFYFLINSPSWWAGSKRGINVKQRFVLPIAYKF